LQLNKLRGLLNKKKAEFLQLGDEGVNKMTLLNSYVSNSNTEAKATELHPKVIKLLKQYRKSMKEEKALERQIETEEANILTTLEAVGNRFFVPLQVDL
jgi:hypothetical protein